MSPFPPSLVKATIIAMTVALNLSRTDATSFGIPRVWASSPTSVCGRDLDGQTTALGFRTPLLDIRGGASPDTSSGDTAGPTKVSKTHTKSSEWHPFPDLALERDYREALRAKRSRTRMMSYKDIAKMQAALHTVEPSSSEEARLQRVYMCRISAERFSQRSSSPRAGLLLGTIERELVEPRGKKRARTSLSSQTEDSQYCTVAKVQALWEPPNQEEDGDYYADCADILEENPRVLAVAKELGLRPIGWIFGYEPETRPDAIAGEITKEGESGLPIVGRDVHTAALLQIGNMKREDDRFDGAKFATLAMDVKTGATEAFQLSDVTVQMVAEGMLSIRSDDVPDATTRKEKANARQRRGHDRYVPTKHAVLVDGSETELLDSVLCLINTALLSHEGTFAGKSASSSPVKKKSGTLTTKTKKAILRCLDSDRDLLETLCDFQIMLALDQILSNDESVTLCRLVHKWSRGQKRATVVPDDLKKRLQSLLES